MHTIDLDPVELAAWCRRHLGAAPVETLFTGGHLAAVVGLRLEGGRTVVVKARPPEARLVACTHVQTHLCAVGYPCAAPLVAPAPLGPFAATAEGFLGGGELHPRDEAAPRHFARALARLIALAPPLATLPTLDPPPAWARWDHEQHGPWPWPDDRDTDLNAHPGPDWLDRAGARIRQRLLATDLPSVVGHADWESQNLRWRDGQLHAAHDWDSIAARPEAAFAGMAAAVFTAAPGQPDATIEESAAFLGAYAEARGRDWNTEERTIAWAAGLWVRAFNAKKASLDPQGGGVVAHFQSEITARLIRAGL